MTRNGARTCVKYLIHQKNIPDLGVVSCNFLDEARTKNQDGGLNFWRENLADIIRLGAEKENFGTLAGTDNEKTLFYISEIISLRSLPQNIFKMDSNFWIEVLIGKILSVNK